MKIAYVKLNDDNKVVRVDTNKIIGYIQVEVEDDMTGDKLLSCSYIDGALKFDDKDYDARINKRKQKNDIAYQRKMDKKKLEQIEMKHRLAALSDDEAVDVISLFESWNKDKSYNKNERIEYNGKLYRVLQDTSGQYIEPDRSFLYSVI